MDRSRKTKTLRRVAQTLLFLVLAALCILAGALVRYFIPPRGSAAPEPSPTASPAYASPEPTQAPTPTPEPTPTPTPEPSPTPVPVELTETADAGQEYIDKFVFLGDSTSYGLAAAGMVPFTQVWTDSIGTMSLFNWEIDPIAYYDPADPYNAVSLSIPDCAARRKPEYLMVTLGINGIALLNEDEFRDYYVNLIQAIQQASPDTKIICQSIFPVIDSRVPNGISSGKVNAANEWIYDMAGQLGVRYLNSHDVLMDSSGQLRTDYTDDTAMGIHLNKTGFEALLMNIRTHAYQ